MHEHTHKTNWLNLIGDRADLGRSIVRLSKLAAAAHMASHASANGMAGSATDRFVNVASRDASAHKEVPR